MTNKSKYLLILFTIFIFSFPSICFSEFDTKDPSWDDIDSVLTKKSGKINIGLIIETKIPDLVGNKREQLENEEEQQFFDMTERKKEKYKVIDRRHLKNILDEQKLSASGITDSETVKLGKILNLDIIVLRMIYDGSRITKILRVDTGEVLLFRTYETKKETKERWVYYQTSEIGDYYYDNRSIVNISNKIVRLWEKTKYSEEGKDYIIKNIKDKKLSIDGWETLDNGISLYELDCVNNTVKEIKIILYNDKRKILSNFDDPNPKINHILPGSISEVLLKKVCPK